MLRGALEYIGRAINDLIIPENTKLTQLAENRGFEIIGGCGRFYLFTNPSLGVIGNIEYMPFCRAALLKRTLGTDEELLVICDDLGLLYRGEHLEGEEMTLNKKCAHCKDMPMVFSQYGDLDFKVVQPSEIKEHLSTTPLITANKP